MLGIMLRKRNTISVFTSRVMSHSDSGPYCLGFLGRHRSHIRRLGPGEQRVTCDTEMKQQGRTDSNRHCTGTRQKKLPGGGMAIPYSHPVPRQP